MFCKIPIYLTQPNVFIKYIAMIN